MEIAFYFGLSVLWMN